MKNLFKNLYPIILVGFATGLVLSSCEGDLEPENFSVIDPSTFFKTESDAEALTFAYYSRFNEGWYGTWLNYKGYGISDAAAGQLHILWGDPLWLRILSFEWSATTRREYQEVYNAYVPAITFATSVIEDLKRVSIDDEVKNQYIAEVRTGRAFMTLMVYDMYGPPAIVVDPEIATDPFTDFDPERWTAEQTVEFIEDELIAAENDLISYKDWPLSEYGRFTTGVAKMARLKLYMMDKQWASAITVSAELMAEGYTLEPDYASIFSADNEANNEIIWAAPVQTDPNIGPTNTSLAATLPGDYRTPSIKANDLASWNGIRVPWEIYDLYEPGDLRTIVLGKDYYVDLPDGSIELQDKRADGTLVIGALNLKYGIDPNANGGHMGNDFIYYRYADALLLRAEALNEVTPLDGEAIQLVQDVRDRADAGAIPASALVSQSTFRDFILDERIRELVGEGWGRQDLIRHGKFVERARTRQTNTVPNAQDFHQLWPIPQTAIDANPKITQNPGY